MKKSPTDASPRLRAKLTNDWVEYPHNDLANAAGFLRERINDAFAAHERPDGIFVDMLACVTMTAFSLEGYVNFLCAKLLHGEADKWKGSKGPNVRDKIKMLLRSMSIEVDWNKRPYSTTAVLTNLRNMLAHPKPIVAEPREWIAEGENSALQTMLRDYEAEWVKLINQKFINEAYEDVELIWKGLLEAANIQEYETWSGGSQSIEVIDP